MTSHLARRPRRRCHRAAAGNARRRHRALRRQGSRSARSRRREAGLALRVRQLAVADGDRHRGNHGARSAHGRLRPRETAAEPAFRSDEEKPPCAAAIGVPSRSVLAPREHLRGIRQRQAPSRRPEGLRGRHQSSTWEKTRFSRQEANRAAPPPPGMRDSGPTRPKPGTAASKRAPLMHRKRAGRAF